MRASGLMEESPQRHTRRLSLVADLTDSAKRQAATIALAEDLGAEDLLIFLPDTECGILLPAPGFPQTLPDGQSWQKFLAACRVSEPRHGSLPVSHPGIRMDTVGIAASCGAVLVLLGGSPQLDDARDVVLLLPLLAVAFHSERLALIAASNARMARQAVNQAQLLTASLDKARAALRIALSDAETAMRAKDRFLAALSHELRTPLTPVLLATAAHENDPQLSLALRRDLTMIRRNVDLEVRLIDDLLDLSRVLAGKLRLRTEPLVLNVQIQHAIEICLPYIQENGIQFTQHLAPDLGLVDADPVRLQQVLWNLLKNAVKFSELGEISITSRISRPGHVQVAVRDSGIGIEAGALARIFDAFEQASVDTPLEFGGLGLGLAISKAIVDLHGGTIQAESEGLGRGSTFTIEFPMRTSPPVGLSTLPPTGPPKQDLEARILVVEDHEDTVLLLTRFLKKSGHTVKTAGRVQDALRLLETESFDLLLSDVGLPDATGYDLMRGASKRQQLTGIAMSGYGMDEDVRKCHEAGFSEHLVKPVDIQQLRETIQRVLTQAGGLKR